MLGQTTTLQLNKPESGNVIKEAEKSITLLPGFSYKAAQGETFIARIADSDKGDSGMSNYNFPTENIDQIPNFYGSIKGSLDVNDMGAAIYTIPIELPVGTAGMQPNLAIVYNSQTGNGILGLKWGIAGLSSISRVNKNTFYDNSVSAISYADAPGNDALTLDGNHLVKLNDGSYMTRIETFAKITVSGSGTSAWFKVEHKNGQTLEYGNTADSRMYATGKSNPLAWYLNKVSDANGNYMLYSYKTLNNEFVLDKITYTGNSKTTLSPYTTITFDYKKRSHLDSQNIAGGEIYSTNILNSITISSENSVVKEFAFEYTELGAFPRLLKITEKFDESTLSSLNINWDSFAKQKTNNIDCNLSKVPLDQIYTGDFDGDGLTDILHYNSTNWEIYYSGNNENKAIMFNDTFNDDSKILIADFDGDGKDDIIVKTTSVWCLVYISKDGSLYESIHWFIMSQGNHVITGNFMKNGRQQILFIPDNMPINNKFYYKLGDDYEYEIETTLKPNRRLDMLFPINIDGNGDHIAVWNSTDKKIEVYNLFSSNNLVATINIDQTDRKNIFSGDTNGDGRDDIITINNDNLCYIYSYTGSGFQLIKQQQLQQFKDYEEVIYDPNSKKIKDVPSKSFEQFIVRDFDGDGKADVLQNMFLYQ